jgi:hypothetical protein
VSRLLKEVFSPSTLVIQCRSLEPSFESCDRESLSLARWTFEVYRSFLRVITPQVLPYLPTSTFPLSHPKIKIIKVQSCSINAYPFFHFFQTPTPIKTDKLVRSRTKPRPARSKSRPRPLPPSTLDTGHLTSHHILPKFIIPPTASRARFTFLSAAHVTVAVSVAVTVGVGAVVVTPVTPAHEQAL